MNRRPIKKTGVRKDKKINKKNFRRKSVPKSRKFVFRRFTLLISCLLVIFLIFWSVHFLLSKIFSIKNISIQGDSGYSDSEIISAGELGVGKDMLFLNSKNVENKIYTSLPNVDEVKISKKFPNKLIISLKNAVPSRCLKIEDEYLVISEKNKFLMKSSEFPQGIIGIVGMEAEIKNNGKVEYKNAELEKLFEEILNLLKDKGINDVNEVDISDLQNIVLTYDNRIRINIGNTEDMDYKILTVKEIINDKISKTEKGILNLKDLKTENRTYFTTE